MTDRHLLRWRELWQDSVDQMYSGPFAERAKTQTARIAWGLYRRLTGIDSKELDAIVRQ